MKELPLVRPPAPLDGYRILDFTERLQGPLGTQTLGDLGADIVKVERLKATTPEGNTVKRYRRTADGCGYDLDLYTAAFLSLNRNKRSIAVDLKSEAGLAVARRLVGVCDVVYENFRPGVMERLSLGYEDCVAINPSIVYASASGYGRDGPYADRRGQDILAQAIGGLATMNAPAGNRPLAVGVPIADVLGGMNGAMAVLAALLYRNRTGEGQRISVNLLDSVLAAQSEEALLFLNAAVQEPQRVTPAHAHPYIPPPYGLYATRDGYIALPSGEQLSELLAILGIAELGRDERFATSQCRNQNRDEFEHLIEEALAGRTTAEWMELMVKEDIYAAPVNTVEQAFDDPQVRHNGMVIDVEAPGGPLSMVASPLHFSKTPPQVRSAPPMLGEHSVEILELAGYGDDEISSILESGAVAGPGSLPSRGRRQKEGF